MNNQLYNSKTLKLYNSFARVKGSGTFHLDEFCAETGMDPNRAIRCLLKAEKLGAILRLGELFLLYPPKPDNRKVWHDWKFDIAKQRMIYDACYTDSPTSRFQACGISCPELRQILPFSKTLLQRYLSAMVRAGILIVQRNGYVNLYRQGTWRELTTYRQERARYANKSKPLKEKSC
jgi:hypothetical protein